MSNEEYVGRIVVRFEHCFDEDTQGEYIKPTRIHNREIGICLNFCEPDHANVFWQEQMKHERIWLGAIAFVDEFENDENRNTQGEIRKEE